MSNQPETVETGLGVGAITQPSALLSRVMSSIDKSMRDLTSNDMRAGRYLATEDGLQRRRGN